MNDSSISQLAVGQHRWPLVIFVVCVALADAVAVDTTRLEATMTRQPLTCLSLVCFFKRAALQVDELGWAGLSRAELVDRLVAPSDLGAATRSRSQLQAAPSERLISRRGRKTEGKRFQYL